MESKKKNGRPTKPIEEHSLITAVSLRPEVRAWLKLQPGGLSKTIDRLAREAMEKQR